MAACKQYNNLSSEQIWRNCHELFNRYDQREVGYTSFAEPCITLFFSVLVLAITRFSATLAINVADSPLPDLP